LFVEILNLGLSVVQRGTMDERLRCKKKKKIDLIIFYFFFPVMFKSYDTDNNGVLSPGEVYQMLKATMGSRGRKYTSESLVDMVSNLFKQVDTNNDAQISFEEFKQAVLSQKIILDNFVNVM
jgi:hypothetical protein